MPTQACPPFSKIALIIFFVAKPKLAFFVIMAQFFPPSSKNIFFNDEEDCLIIFLPVSVEPTNEMAEIFFHYKLNFQL